MKEATPTDAPGPQGTCSTCAHFEDDPFVLEETFKAMRTLSSAWASVRGDSGVCRVDDRFKMPRGACRDFTPRSRIVNT